MEYFAIQEELKVFSLFHELYRHDSNMFLVHFYQQLLAQTMLIATLWSLFYKSKTNKEIQISIRYI